MSQLASDDQDRLDWIENAVRTNSRPSDLRITDMRVAVEQAPAGADALDDDDKREISTLLEAIQGDVTHYPFGPE
jgi:hypothetical protein